jgi:hypothetical protein
MPNVQIVNLSIVSYVRFLVWKKACQTMLEFSSNFVLTTRIAG